MKPLDKDLRDKLARVVEEAREVAETAARYALQQLSVGESSPYKHLSAEERELRRRLRAHGRQLGDIRNSWDETQEIERLLEEVAYQHWHRMLFAKFLAENNLLMYPDPVSPVPVSLEECEELAPDEGARDGWELAARFAQSMLPQIFRADSPLFEITFAPEYQKRLEDLLDELPSGVFEASDSIGWIYQFWQAKQKAEINASEVKIGARELPAMTQLFTESYMVKFLLDNSLGAWWAIQQLSEEDLDIADSEDELRRKASIPGVPLQYLRFVKHEQEGWVTASGSFDSWPKELSCLKILDPCCGSGNFLVEAFLMLVPMRMKVEGICATDAIDAVLRDNLHGLEVDPRCVTLAAFSLALEAWRYPNAGGYRALPYLNVACSGIAIEGEREDWLSLSGGDRDIERVLAELHTQFRDAPVLGSLIDPMSTLSSGTLFEIEWERLESVLNQVLSRGMDCERKELAIAAQGLSKAASLLSSKYHLVITNVPYLKRGNQGKILRDFTDSYYNVSRGDLATTFLDRCLRFCHEHGVVNVVMPQNWLFLTSYTGFRVKLLEEEQWNLLARLGSGAFDTISGEVVKAILLSITKLDRMCRREKDPQHAISCIDVSEVIAVKDKAGGLVDLTVEFIDQQKQLENPDSRLLLEGFSHDTPLLESIAESGGGVSSFDSPRFIFKFWEFRELERKTYIYCQSSPSKEQEFSGRSQVLKWEEGRGDLRQLMMDKQELEGYSSGIWRVWSRFMGRPGVCVGLMNDLKATLYDGYAFDNNTAVIVPSDREHLPAIWSLCSTDEYNRRVRVLDQKLNVTSGTLVKVPFELDYWTNVANDKFSSGLPKPYSNDPTQWCFHGYPSYSTDILQVAVARLIGYRWPSEVDETMDLSDETHALIQKCRVLEEFCDDGIICIPSVSREPSAADRLTGFLAAVFQEKWSASTLSDVLTQSGHSGETLETWLRDKFFIQHCKLFHDRPFIWQLWDGLPDGFSVLVNYHKLDRRKLETLIYTYLGDWILRQKSDIVSGVDGAQERLDAAESLKQKLELILVGEEPHDIFVRWKPIENQPIGWEPDINDGVRINIRPFMTVGDVRKKGAGVLRDKPNIKWGKDRGKDVESAPWYHIFGADRINDHHLTIAEKQAAREAAKKVNKR